MINFAVDRGGDCDFFSLTVRCRKLEKPRHITVYGVKRNIETIFKPSSEDHNCCLSKIL